MCVNVGIISDNSEFREMIAGFYFPLRLPGIPIDIHKEIVNVAA